MLSGRVKSCVAECMDQGLGCGVVDDFFGGGQDCEEWGDCSDAEDFGEGGGYH